MKLSDQLITRLNKELGIMVPLGTKLKYIKPSLNQQARGSFMWVFDHETYCRYGSTVGVKEILKAENIETNSITYGGLSVLSASLVDILPV